jgi:hypothetical protein
MDVRLLFHIDTENQTYVFSGLQSHSQFAFSPMLRSQYKAPVGLYVAQERVQFRKWKNVGAEGQTSISHRPERLCPNCLMALSGYTAETVLGS